MVHLESHMKIQLLRCVGNDPSLRQEIVRVTAEGQEIDSSYLVDLTGVSFGTYHCPHV